MVRYQLPFRGDRSDQLPRWSHHARLRYLQRVGVSAPQPAIAWTEARCVERPPRGCDSARRHPGLNAVFVAKDGTVVTVLRAQFNEHPPNLRTEREDVA